MTKMAAVLAKLLQFLSPEEFGLSVLPPLALFDVETLPALSNLPSGKA